VFDFSVIPRDGFIIVFNTKENYFYGGHWQDGKLTLTDDDGIKFEPKTLENLRWKYDKCNRSGIQGR
jgi:hypothetical protein